MSALEEAFEQYERGRLTGEEAGELLGMSGRNFRRLCVRYEEDGIEGLRDRRFGKVSPRRAPAGELARMQALYRECYGDFTVKHFHEQLVKLHHYKLCYTVTKASLQAAGLVAKAKSAVAPNRKRRERRPLTAWHARPRLGQLFCGGADRPRERSSRVVFKAERGQSSARHAGLLLHHVRAGSGPCRIF